MHLGQRARLSRIFTQKDFDRFAALSGDDNPIHVDAAFSAGTRFGRTVAHGMLLYSAVCAALGTILPGPGTLQLTQEMMFPNPTYTGEELTVSLEVTGLQPDAGLANLTTNVIRPDGKLGLRGQTLVRLPKTSLGCWPTSRPAGLTMPQPDGRHACSSFLGLTLGQRAEMRRSFSVQDLDEYSDLTDDTNPIFVDQEFAQNCGLEGPLIPGGLLGGMFSSLLGTRLPGQGTNYLKQRLEFLIPAYPGEQLTATVEIVRLRPGKQLANLNTLCTNQAGELVCRGEALVLVSDLESV